MGHGSEAHPHHPHAHGTTEAHNAGAGQGAVLLDVGAGTGALVLLASADMHHVEIEVSPVGDDAARTHVAVLPRPAGGRQVYAAVYPGLAEGAWTVWSPDGDSPVLVATVPGGGVAEAVWPGVTGA